MYSTLAGRRMMKIDMASKTVKTSKSVGQMQEKLKCLMPTMEAVVGVTEIKNQMEMLFQSSQSSLQMWSHPQNRFSRKKKTHTSTESE